MPGLYTVKLLFLHSLMESMLERILWYYANIDIDILFLSKAYIIILAGNFAINNYYCGVLTGKF